MSGASTTTAATAAWFSAAIGQLIPLGALWHFITWTVDATPVAVTVAANTNAVAGPSTPTPTPVPATPVPLTLEQQHITTVEGIIPTLQNIIATVNLDCRLDLKTIALHARNAEYNPKVGTQAFL
jgi:hypothetical protein